MKKLLNILKWTAIVLIGTPVLIYLLWAAANLHKDELNPELEKLLAQHPAQLNEKDNAYFDTIGLAAPDNMEPHTWGVSWFTQANANDRAANAGEMPAPIQLAGYPSKFAQNDLPCTRKDSRLTCLEEVAANPSLAQQHLAAEALLLQRFDAVLHRDYQEPHRETSYLSEFAPIGSEFRAIKLALIRIALEIAQGRDDAALGRWQKETAFILRQAAHSHSLVDKMVQTSALQRYQKLLADYLSTHPRAARGKSKQILALLAPYDKEAVTLQAAFENEASASTRFVLSPQMANGREEGATLSEQVLAKLSLPLLDRPATANEFAKHHLEWSRIATLEGTAYRAALAEQTAKLQQSLGNTNVLSLHNPVGKFILASADVPDCAPYFFKSDDILANKQLLAFAIGLISRNATSSAQIAREIEANRAVLEHPFTGALPVWDAQKRTLGYTIPAQIKGSNYVPLVVKF